MLEHMFVLNSGFRVVLKPEISLSIAAYVCES